MADSTEPVPTPATPQPWTDAEQLDFYRRMYFEYVELFTSTAAGAIQLASEGRWFDLIEMCGDRLNARDAVEEGDAEVYELARPKAKTADAAPDLLAACEAFLNPELRASHVTRLVSDAVAKARGNQ